jgi:hypothetical protein
VTRARAQRCATVEERGKGSSGWRIDSMTVGPMRSTRDAMVAWRIHMSQVIRPKVTT